MHLARREMPSSSEEHKTRSVEFARFAEEEEDLEEEVLEEEEVLVER